MQGLEDLPGRRVAEAGVEVAASGFLGVTIAGAESFDDLDMIENFLSKPELLREPFRNRLKDGMVLLCEERFVDCG